MPRGWIIGGASFAVFCFAAAGAQAAPWASSGDMRSAAPETPLVEKVAARRCWWRHGERHCTYRRARPRVYGYRYYGYGRPHPEAFPTGSTAWWRAMDYEGRGGHGRTP